jgi:hypothetical protein
VWERKDYVFGHLLSAQGFAWGDGCSTTGQDGARPPLSRFTPIADPVRRPTASHCCPPSHPPCCQTLDSSPETSTMCSKPQRGFDGKNTNQKVFWRLMGINVCYYFYMLMPGSCARRVPSFVPGCGPALRVTMFVGFSDQPNPALNSAPVAQACPAAVARFAADVAHTGRLAVPVVSAHGINDATVFVEDSNTLRQRTVAAANGLRAGANLWACCRQTPGLAWRATDRTCVAASPPAPRGIR